MAEVPLCVIDNSVVVKWYLQEDFADQQAIDIVHDYTVGRIALVAPHILPYELAGVLRREVNRRTISEARGRQSYQGFIAHQIMFLDPPGIHYTAYDYGTRYSVRYFDALYLALAQIENCQIITYDRPFYEAMPANRRLWLPDYQSPR